MKVCGDYIVRVAGGIPTIDLLPPGEELYSREIAMGAIARKMSDYLGREYQYSHRTFSRDLSLAQGNYRRWGRPYEQGFSRGQIGILFAIRKAFAQKRSRGWIADRLRAANREETTNGQNAA